MGRRDLLTGDERRALFGLPRGGLDGVELKGADLRVAPLTAIKPPEADRLDLVVDRLMPRVRITELLGEVDTRTGFTAAFPELRSGRQHPNPPALLAAILADATNLGVERMPTPAKASPTPSSPGPMASTYPRRTMPRRCATSSTHRLHCR